MTNEECFDIWAPEGAAWSPWAKPVLFMQLPHVTPTAEDDGSLPDLFWVPDAGGRTAIVVDLPGLESLRTGLALATRGYRPVPLYNTSVGPSALVACDAIARGLSADAGTLRGIALPLDAPPAFLLDANRMTPVVPPKPGAFDNRWMVFPQDFPSATYLRARGVADVLLLHAARDSSEDLAHVLLRWQEAGVRLLSSSPADRGRIRDLIVTRPSRFRRAWYRLIAMAGLRRNNAGGFGGVIPTPSSGGGFA
jgi:hypothetical protein